MKGSKAELCIKQSCFAEYFPGSSVRPLSQVGFPAWDGPCCFGQRCHTLCPCLWGWAISAWHGVTLYHACFPITMSAFWVPSLCQRGPDVSSCAVFNCQTNSSFYWSPSEGCMLSSAFHITEKLCNLFFTNIKNKKLSFQKKFRYTFRKGLVLLNVMYATHNIATFKYTCTHTKPFWIIMSRRR